MRIYIADLAAYNNGILHGVWVDLELMSDQSEVQDIINEMLENSPIDDAEEYEIHDHEGLPFSGEPSLQQVFEYLEALGASENHELFNELVTLHSGDYDEALRVINEATIYDYEYGMGNTNRSFITEREVIESFVYDQVMEGLELPDIIKCHFDYERAWENDLSHEFEMIKCESTIYFVSKV